MGRAIRSLIFPLHPKFYRLISSKMGKKKFLTQSELKIGLIADEDTVTGMVLAGIGHVDGQGKKNFMIVDSKTHQKAVEEKFHELTSRKDIAMILITQTCANDIRYAVEAYGETGQVVPTVLEIPSKDTPYDPRKDTIMQRVAFFMPSAMEKLGITV